MAAVSTSAGGPCAAKASGTSSSTVVASRPLSASALSMPSR